MNLRKGRTKDLLERSIDSALLAVEIYNKPRAPYRVETYITNMIMAWTKLFHAYFQNTIGDRYFYKEKNGRYRLIDGERKAWELVTCIKNYGNISEPVKANLLFFIKLRNKIEHRSINREQIGVIIFGECQSLLYNYENELVKLFGEDYAINENLAFSLQFSRVRKKEQLEASRKLLSPEVQDLKVFIDNYRSSISEEVYNSQDYSIKLIQIPKISNTNKSDLAIEFVNWSNLSESDRVNYSKVCAIIKDKVVRQEAVNPGKLKPGEIIARVNSSIEHPINQYDHKCILSILSIRPYKDFLGNDDPYRTNTSFCHFDETHNDYVYQNAWAEFLIEKINQGALTKQIWVDYYKNKQIVDISTL